MTASLNHPGIAAVHDYGETASVPDGPKDTAYLVMELVEGEPLAAIIAAAAARPPTGRWTCWSRPGNALQAAHERGLRAPRRQAGQHPGDARPGKVKITDFGIAKAADAAPVTRSGMVMGTAHYIAPEQALGHEAEPAQRRVLARRVRLRVPRRAPPVPVGERGDRRDDAHPRHAAAAAAGRAAGRARVDRGDAGEGPAAALPQRRRVRRGGRRGAGRPPAADAVRTRDALVRCRSRRCTRTTHPGSRSGMPAGHADGTDRVPPDTGTFRHSAATACAAGAQPDRPVGYGRCPGGRAACVLGVVIAVDG